MKRAILQNNSARCRPKKPDNGGLIERSRPETYRRLLMVFGALCAVMLAHGPVLAADRTTCTMAVKLLETIDKGLDAATAGDARGATSGIAVFAQQTQDMAERHFADDPLPDDVAAALSAILTETASQYFIATAALVLLEQALVIQQAMPDICAGSEIPDMNRHVN